MTHSWCRLRLARFSAKQLLLSPKQNRRTPLQISCNDPSKNLPKTNCSERLVKFRGLRRLDTSHSKISRIYWELSGNNTKPPIVFEESMVQFHERISFEPFLNLFSSVSVRMNAIQAKVADTCFFVRYMHDMTRINEIDLSTRLLDIFYHYFIFSINGSAWASIK